jgi:hypothetical protein
LGGWVFFTTRRFLLDLDIDAPKVVIPTEFYPDGKHQCKLFLDLGHFKIMTVPVYFLRLSLSLPLSLSLSSSLFSPFLLGFVNDWFGKKMIGTITYIFLMIDQALNLALRHKISELGEKRILCSLH